MDKTDSATVRKACKYRKSSMAYLCESAVKIRRWIGENAKWDGKSAQWQKNVGHIAQNNERETGQSYKNTKFHSWNLCKGLTYFRKGCIIFDMKEGILVCVLW